MGMRSLISCMTRNIPYRIALFMWNMFGCLCMPLHVHFRWGVALVRKLLYWALLTPLWVNIFQALEVHRGMERIQDLSGEEKSIFGLVLYFINFG